MPLPKTAEQRRAEAIEFLRTMPALLVDMSVMARAFGWKTRRTRKLLINYEATEFLNGRHYTSRDLVFEKLPHLAKRIWPRVEVVEAADDG